MKYVVLLCTLFLCTLQTFSQQDYFIYLQSDNNQPFYIRIHDTVYSSSASGYIILTKLPDSTAPVTIGFAGSVFPEQQFNIPVNHKDAGFVLRNTDRGWALTNLQSQAVIMSSTTEKKNPDISGSRRTDAFSALLASAVNDTSVLYTVVRPPKPAPVAQKKPDSLAIAKNTLPKDSIAPVKNPLKTDSSLSAKKTTRPAKDTSTIVHKGKPRPPLIAKNSRPVHDTAATIKRNNTAVAANRSVKPRQPANLKNRKTIADTNLVAHQPAAPVSDTAQQSRVAKKDSVVTVKRAPSQKPDTVFVTVGSSRKQVDLTKNKKQRKDTIILMSGRTPAARNEVAKHSPVVPEKKVTQAAPHDTVQVIKKEILQAPEEKRNALLNNNDAVVIETVPAKKDSVPSTSTQKDNTANEPMPASPKTDSLATTPVRRLRPLVTKAAELLTDTSYIAVFVDESKDKFDTIRISIPFNEINAFAAKLRRADTMAVKTIDTTVATTVPAVVPSSPKTDTLRSIAKDTTPASAPLQIAVTEKHDSATGSNHTDSSAANTLSIAEKKDTVVTHRDSLPVMDKRNNIPAAAKQDSLASLPPKTDTTKVTKTPAQALFLNSDCKEVAADADIDKLRIKMLLVVSDEDRITLAKRVLRQKCFLVQQVKALSELFKSDEGKYKWFDAAYPFVSDTGNFASLGDLIKDDYYLNRFKAMLRH